MRSTRIVCYGEIHVDAIGADTRPEGEITPTGLQLCHNGNGGMFVTNWALRFVKTVPVALLVFLGQMAAFALPGEDHWTIGLTPEEAAVFEEAATLIEREEFTAAVPILEKLAADLPANADVFNMLGFAYRNTGDLQKSAPAYERALYLKPDHLQALEYQGELFLLLGNIKGAEENLSLMDEHCAFPCLERDELSEAIEAWRTENAQ